MSEEGEKDVTIARITSELQQMPGSDAMARARIVRAALHDAERGRSGWWRWWIEPHAVRVTPAAALLAAAIVVAVSLALGRVARTDTTVARVQPVDTPARQASVATTPVAVASVIRFELVAPAAQRVTLVGDFNAWDASATPLVRDGGGAWVGTVTLAPGRHVYAFVVDGSTWRPDPTAPRAPGDDFGAPSSVIVVGAPL